MSRTGRTARSGAADGRIARTLTLMTRENKLALVVGFGLILLVGILISDHFSVARNQAAAKLGQVVDPLAGTRDAPADLIALRPAAEKTQVVPRLAPPPARTDAYDDVRPVASEVVTAIPDTIEMGRPAPPRVGLDPREAEQLPYTIHVIRDGESLSSICGARFGDPSLALELARYNEIDDPDRVRSGDRLRIPSAGDLVRGRPAPAPATARAGTNSVPARTADDAPSTYTVKKGDVLSEIASRVLGSSRKYLVLYELNRDILDSPDALREGMTLRLPADSG